MYNLCLPMHFPDPLVNVIIYHFPYINPMFFSSFQLLSVDLFYSPFPEQKRYSTGTYHLFLFFVLSAYALLDLT